MIVSFYTENWYCPHHAERMRKLLDQFKIPHDIQFLKGRGRWMDNTRIKAAFIYEMLHTYKRFLWVDIDSEIVDNPFPQIMSNFTGDLLLRRHSTLNDRLYHVSVMGWTSNDTTKRLCKEWIQEGEEHVGTDELSFDLAIKKFNQPLSIHLLDPMYHRLPKEDVKNPCITIGLSIDPTKRSKP
ncbi:hypothetical protein COMNV_00448 [Commensalibacter sp. Nvir]|uniref:hypothetical protein n=1 Tax=Commensalibacter sp. Nvir TaxID=3069817 RepID=UPI002D42F4E2|nr:hypothetical protein COMNV_00448 [Commensalibacter sp. Nvir]